MENADGIAQWNASGSRKKSIVAAGSRAEQLEASASRMLGSEGACQNGKAQEGRGRVALVYPRFGPTDCVDIAMI